MHDLTTPEGKAAFIEDHAAMIVRQLLPKIQHMPAEWEGIHLRLLFAEMAESETNFPHLRPAAKRAITRSGFWMEAGR